MSEAWVVERLEDGERWRFIKAFQSPAFAQAYADSAGANRLWDYRVAKYVPETAIEEAIRADRERIVGALMEFIEGMK